MKNSPDTQKFQTGNVILIAFSHLIHDIYGAFLAPILPLLMEKLGFSYTLAGFLTVAQRFPSLLNPLLGVIADRVSVRYFVIGAPTVTAISMSLLGLAPSYPVLVVLLVIMGISAACYHVPTPVMIKQIAGKHIGKGMSFYMFAGELARTIGPLVIIGVVSRWGLERTYWLILPGLLASVFLAVKFRRMPVQQTAHATPASGLGQTLVDMRATLLGLTGISIFIGGLKGAMVIFLPAYLTAKGASLVVAGVSLSVLEAGGVIGVLTAGTLSDRWGRKFVLLAGDFRHSGAHVVFPAGPWFPDLPHPVSPGLFPAVKRPGHARDCPGKRLRAPRVCQRDLHDDQFCGRVQHDRSGGRLK